MDDIDKALDKLTKKEKSVLRDILESLKQWPWKGLNVEKLKNTDKVFRVKKGKMRIIFRLEDEGKIFILKIDKRSDKTYKDL